MNSLIFLNTNELLQNSFFSTIPLKKNRDCNRETVSSITPKILQCDMEFCYKIISKFRTFRKFFKISKITFKNVKKIEKIHMDPEK